MKSFPGNLEKIAILTPSLVTLFVTNRFSIDPVNIPKMFILVVAATALLALMIARAKELCFNTNALLLVCGFNVFFLISALVSESPWQLMFYGVDGRNTGILTYLGLSVLFMAATQVINEKATYFFVRSVVFVGAINIIYGILQMRKIEFLDWNNTYNSALGTLGNPNFFSSIAGISVIALIPFLFQKPTKYFQIYFVLHTLIAVAAILVSKSIQGLAVIFVGALFIGLVKVRFSQNRIARVSFLVLAPTTFLIGIAGLLQKGPLSSILYQPSISLRGFYWRAGLNMFKDNWMFGVGPDSFGDWYRTYRPPAAILPPGGIDVNTNAAHNVFIDLLANGGIFVFLFYLGIIVLTFTNIYKKLFLQKSNNPYFLSATLIWIGYLVQSVISINQIGLAVWGWAAGGLILSSSFEPKSTLGNKNRNVAVKTRDAKTDFSNFTVGFGLVIGILIALPPLKADHAWYLAMRSGKVEIFVDAAKAQPLDSKRLLDATNILDQNKYFKEARALNKLAREHDSNFYYTWLAMYNGQSTTEAEKLIAKENLHRLDPLNPNWK